MSHEPTAPRVVARMLTAMALSCVSQWSGRLSTYSGSRALRLLAGLGDDASDVVDRAGDVDGLVERAAEQFGVDPEHVQRAIGRREGRGLVRSHLRPERYHALVTSALDLHGPAWSPDYRQAVTVAAYDVVHVLALDGPDAPSPARIAEVVENRAHADADVVSSDLADIVQTIRRAAS